MRQETMARWRRDNFPLRVVATDMKDTVPIHSHDFIELVVFTKGTATHSIYHGSKRLRYSVMQGDCFSILPNEKHTFEDGNLAYYYNIIFSPELIPHELDELKEFQTWNTLFGFKAFNERIKVHLGLNDREEINDYIRRLANELEKRQAGYKICARALLLEILLIILRCTPKRMLLTQTSAQSNQAVLGAIDEMEMHPERRHSLNELAKAANMCVSGFTKKFRGMTGLSPTEYLLSLRIEKAEKMLLETTMTVYDIAEKCGYYDVNYFIKVFRRHRHTTPARFRNANIL